MPRLRIIAIGELDHPEFLEVGRWLNAQNARRFESCEAALPAAPSASHCFLLASHRGVFDRPEIEALHRASPLMMLVHVVGSWCEGETRSGRALAGVPRVVWHQFVPRATAMLQGEIDYAGWSLPRTATPIDVSLHANPRRVRLSASATVGVVTETHSDFLALAECLGACGAKAIRVSVDPFDEQSQAIVWDGRSLDSRSTIALQSLVTVAASRPIVALLDAPRIQEIEAAIRMGVARVLAKPLLLGDLKGELARLGAVTIAGPARLTA